VVDEHSDEERLYGEMGRLKMELDGLKKTMGANGPCPRSHKVESDTCLVGKGGVTRGKTQRAEATDERRIRPERTPCPARGNDLPVGDTSWRKMATRQGHRCSGFFLSIFNYRNFIYYQESYLMI